MGSTLIEKIIEKNTIAMICWTFWMVRVLKKCLVNLMRKIALLLDQSLSM